MPPDHPKESFPLFLVDRVGISATNNDNKQMSKRKRNSAVAPNEGVPQNICSAVEIRVAGKFKLPSYSFARKLFLTFQSVLAG